MATSGDLQLALLIKANAEQAKAELASVQAQLQGVEATAATTGSNAAASVAQLTEASTQAASAAAGTADAAASASQALNAWGETAEQQTARLKAVAQAAVAEREAATASAAAATRTTDATAAQSVAWRDLAAAQTASMQAGTRAFLAREEGLAILQKSKLTTADVARAEALLGEAVAGSAMSNRLMIDTLAQVDASKVKDAIVEDAATKATQANTKANIENAASQKLGGKGRNSRTTYTVSALIDDAATGQFSRSRREMAALANETGLLGKIMTPTGLAIGGVVVALGLLAVAFVKGEAESDAFNRALISTGQAGTATAGQLVDMADRVGAASGRYGDAVTALTQFANTGKYTSNQLEGLTQTAVEFATMTGGKVADGVKFVDGVMSGNIGTLMKLDEQYHFLTASQQEQIRTLLDQGNQEQATAIAQRAASQAVHARAQEVQDNAGIMIRAWDDVKSAASGAWAAMKDVGATHSLGQQKADLLAELAKAQVPQYVGAGNYIPVDETRIADLRSQIAEINHKLAVQGVQQAQAAVDQNAETKSKQGLTYLDKFKKPLEAFNDATKQAKAALDKAMLGNLTDAEIAQAKEHYKQALDVAQKAYDSATKQHGRKGPDLDAIAGRSAADAIKSQLQTLSNAYQNEQQTLDAQHKAGIVSDQQYFAQRLKDLTDFTDQRIALLQKERAAIEASATTPAAKARAAAQLAAIDEQITQAQQTEVAKRAQIEADEKKAIDDAHKAWVQLEQALGIPVSVNTDQAVEKLRQLQAIIDKLKGTSQEPSAGAQQAAIEGTLQIGTQAQGNYRSLRNIPGAANRNNPLGQANQDIDTENSLFNSNETQIGQNYAAEMTAAQGNAQRMMQIQQAYDAASEKEQQRHTQAMSQLSEARYYGELDTASDVFGQLATLASSQNKKVAAIGKAAAITQAMIKTYQAAQSAYAAGMETGGPAAPYIAAAYAAIAVAAGLANVAQIRSQGTGAGYSKGGYTGDAPVTQAVGFVHGREGVLSAPEVDAIGGEAGFNALRSAIRRGYADGGYVSPYANAPSPAELGFNAPSMPRVQLPSPAAMQSAPPVVNVKAVLAINPDEIAHHVMNTPTGQKAIVVTVGNNPRAIQGKWSAG